ncbi:TPA: argininosuccinate synthase, partial [Candidatus Woesearchaeota archaeon]|nr:argininosuccinate synthase [Candidatus Woesearchaeota archaeon]
MVDLEGKHVVLAYSGGLDTSVILHWLINQKKARVSAFMADVGQGEELEPAREKAIALGAECVRVVDIRDEFVRDFVYPAIRADVRYEGRYLLGTSLARPVTAKAHVAVALGVAGSESVILSHGATE